MKKWFIIEITAVFIFAVIGFLGKISFQDRGIIGIRTLEDVRSLDCNVNQLFTEEDVDLFIEGAVASFQNSSENVDVFVVKPMNNLRQYNYTMIQEAEVVEVIRGNSVKNNIIQIVTSGGVYDQKYKFHEYDNPRPLFYGMMNLMFSDNLYLVFLQPLETNVYERVERYFTAFTLFSTLNITSDYSIPANVDITKVHYNDFGNSEFLCDSDSTIDKILKFKKEIINAFLTEEQINRLNSNVNN